MGASVAWGRSGRKADRRDLHRVDQPQSRGAESTSELPKSWPEKAFMPSVKSWCSERDGPDRCERGFGDTTGTVPFGEERRPASTSLRSFGARTRASQPAT